MLIKNDSILTNHFSQETLEKNILRSPPHFFGIFTDSESKIVSYLTNYHYERDRVFPSQYTIADKTGTSRATVKRALNKMRQAGMIESYQRWNTSCVYRFSPVLKKPEVKSRILSYFQLLFSITLTLLLSSSQCRNTKGEPLERFNGIYLNGNHGKERVSLKTDGSLFGENSSRDRTDMGKKTIPKKGMTMEDPQKEKIVEGIAYHLPLTPHGKINLMKYPAAALKEAKGWVPFALHKKDPYRYLLFLCERFCKNNKLAINRTDYHFKRNRLGIPLGDENFIDKARFVVPKKKPQISTKAKESDIDNSKTQAYKKFVPEKSMSVKEKVDACNEFLEMKIDNPFAKMFQDIIRGTRPV